MPSVLFTGTYIYYIYIYICICMYVHVYVHTYVYKMQMDVSEHGWALLRYGCAHGMLGICGCHSVSTYVRTWVISALLCLLVSVCNGLNCPPVVQVQCTSVPQFSQFLSSASNEHSLLPWCRVSVFPD